MEVSRDKRNCDGDEEEERKRGTGRPRKDEPTQTVYRVKAEFAEDKSVIEKEMLKKGKFIVASPVRA